MKFCSQCGSTVEVNIPEGDNRPRHVCAACGTIHYQNPKIVVGCIPVWQEKVLLCRRAIEPRYGFWTVPAGFMENGETSQQGAARETLEEACARVDVEGLYTLFNLPHINQIYLLFRSRLLDLDFGAGAESLDVGLFEEHEIPWDEIAFPVVRETLRLYFKDREQADFPLRGGTIERLPGEGRRFRVLLDGETD
ncbi:MAG: NUDIX hydrolase [Candidatus Thiodiazotropha sp. (ex Myrtea spinifera)]|nr:NUDIX hydrolase [Candidatus Thiodiazotropha sp. (ex Myrtea spinifera)]MCU7829199.1 NUDIX hydrolase [Candidatus Thiodiazotropha sp. (ex Myrtea sp. 'scaly one' KF741663)]